MSPERKCLRCGHDIKNDKCDTCSITYAKLSYKGKQYNNAAEVLKAMKQFRAERRKRVRETADYMYFKKRFDMIKARKKQRKQDNDNFKHNQKSDNPNKKITEYFK